VRVVYVRHGTKHFRAPKSPELPRIPIPRNRVNKGTKKRERAEAATTPRPN
jgi:hypothetical protein